MRAYIGTGVGCSMLCCIVEVCPGGVSACPGHVELYKGADTAGQIQPEEPEWNRLGYGNNAIQNVCFQVK